MASLRSLFNPVLGPSKSEEQRIKSEKEISELCEIVDEYIDISNRFQISMMNQGQALDFRPLKMPLIEKEYGQGTLEDMMRICEVYDVGDITMLSQFASSYSKIKQSGDSTPENEPSLSEFIMNTKKYYPELHYYPSIIILYDQLDEEIKNVKAQITDTISKTDDAHINKKEFMENLENRIEQAQTSLKLLSIEMGIDKQRHLLPESYQSEHLDGQRTLS